MPRKMFSQSAIDDALQRAQKGLQRVQRLLGRVPEPEVISFEKLVWYGPMASGRTWRDVPGSWMGELLFVPSANSNGLLTHVKLSVRQDTLFLPEVLGVFSLDDKDFHVDLDHFARRLNIALDVNPDSLPSAQLEFSF